MKTKLIACTLGVFLTILSVSAAKTGVDVNIKNLGNDTIFVLYVPLLNFENSTVEKLDTIVAKNGQFHFDAPTKDPVMILMTPKSTYWTPQNSFSPLYKSIELKLKGNEYVEVKGVFSNRFIDYDLKGSNFNVAISALRKSNLENYRKASGLETSLDSIFRVNPDDTTLIKLSALYDSTLVSLYNKQLNYIKKNFDDELSAYLMIYQEKDTLYKYYNSLSDANKKGDFGGILKMYVDKYKKKLEQNKLREEAKKKVSEGMIAPDFILKDIEGKDFTLSSLKGQKYLVLDFWGSWCSWCIKGIPKMKEYYAKYKDKLEIIGIDCRDTEEKWKKAVKDNDLTWKHVFNSTNPEIDLSIKYAIEGYPTKIILDKDLKIVKVILGESEEFYTTLDNLLK